MMEGDASPQPLVTVAIPAFNRPQGLRRAVESALSQTYANLEVLISDDGSTDETPAVCRELAADPRVRCLLQAVNRGFTPNVNVLIDHYRGDYLMFLGDDDWLGPRHIEESLRVLEADPTAAFASVTVITVWPDGRETQRWAPLRLLHPSPVRRVIDLYGCWHDKVGAFYALRPRRVQERLGHLPNFWANEQIFSAALAFTGRVVRAAEAVYYRSPGGVSAVHSELGRAQRLSSFQWRHRLAAFSWFAVTDILWRSPAYRSLSLPGRAALAAASVPPYLGLRAVYRLEKGARRTRGRLRRRLRPLRALRNRLRRAVGKLPRRAAKRRRRTARRLRRSAPIARLRRGGHPATPGDRTQPTTVMSGVRAAKRPPHSRT